MPNETQGVFERGAVVLSMDTEQIWGYMDSMNERQFQNAYPNTAATHDRLLGRLCAAGVRATWFVVGGLALRDSAGAHDPRTIGLPAEWVHPIPSGNEASSPLWFRPSFIERLRDAVPRQEIGLHGGLTHLVWTDSRATAEAIRQELSGGIAALNGMRVEPRSFSFSRTEEAYHASLPAAGIRCFRGRPPALAWRLGRTLSGAVMRATDELRAATPPVVWPRQHFRGLWNIPASMFLYPIGPTRARLVGLRSRVERFGRGLDAAARHRGIFHFAFHPENLAESSQGFSILDDILALLIRARTTGDIEILSMSDVVERMEKEHHYVQSNQQHFHEEIFEPSRRV